MKLTDQQYERIAQWLDGGDVTLSEDEQIAAEEIRGDEAVLCDAMQTAAPRSALTRAQNRMAAELARPARWVVWARRGVAAAAMAAAAIILITVFVHMPAIDKPKPAGGPSTVAKVDIPIDVILDEMENSNDPTDTVVIDLLAGELDQLQAEMLAVSVTNSSNNTIDLNLNAIEDELEDVLINDPATLLLDEDTQTS